MKGNSSCRIPNDIYRENYDAIFRTPVWGVGTIEVPHFFTKDESFIEMSRVQNPESWSLEDEDEG